MKVRRWGFRARLTFLIATVFILGGTVLLTVQYLLVRHLFAQGLTSVAIGCVSAGRTNDACGAGGENWTIDDRDGGVVSVVMQQTTMLSNEVLSGLLGWSIVVLLIFAGVAVLAAWWLSRRSLGRIAQITQTTRQITRDELHRRLALPGPDDEIKELGDTIDSMLDRLDDAFTRQERFITSASHELRTPLTTTRTALEIPLVQGRVPASLEPDLQRALAANQRSEQLIAALLTLARQGHQRSVPTDVTTEVTAIVDDCLTAHRGALDARGIEVTMSLGPQAHVAADPTLAEIAIANLIENAARHGTEGGRVIVAVDTQHEAVTLRVENDGPVMTDTEIGRLVEPFNRGNHTRLAGSGTGLGLTIVDAIARNAGGTLTLTARDGGGLIAELRLPAPRARPGGRPHG